MYTKEQLSNHIFFEKLLQTKDITNILDSLTGIILRPYIIKFVEYLIQEQIPFTVAIMDLDNFKSINDNYGHKVGDQVLSGVCNDLVDYMGDIGYAGRIGGDEFMIVNLRDIEYSDKKIFYQEMYANYKVLRKNIKLATCDPFITATIGSATFPNDAATYDDLFALMDKTLYRGKNKGRNCYIIYVEEKHKNLEIKELTKHGIYQTFHDLSDAFDEGNNVHEKLERMFYSIKEDMRIGNLYYITEENKVFDINRTVSGESVNGIDALVTNDIFKSNSIEDIKNISPDFYNFLRTHELETILVIKVRLKDRTMGYIMCAEPRNLRIWQDDEGAILFFIGRLLAGYIDGTDVKM